jgi:hypothetical protein
LECDTSSSPRDIDLKEI